jgi:hypothetical protein
MRVAFDEAVKLDGSARRVLILVFILHHGRAEGHECKLGDLEALHAEWDADDSDIKQRAENSSFNRKRNTAEDDPQNIQQQRYRTAAVDNFFSERKEAKTRKLETLYADRNSDDADTPEKTGDKPTDSSKKTAEDEPDDISKTTHG